MKKPFRFGDIPEDPRKLLSDCTVNFYRASGPGGQHRNKTETAVRLLHRPTGISAVAADERSQTRNRAMALERLQDKLIRKLKPKNVRHATRVPGMENRRRLDTKRRVAMKKRLRGFREEE